MTTEGMFIEMNKMIDEMSDELDAMNKKLSEILEVIEQGKRK